MEDNYTNQENTLNKLLKKLNTLNSSSGFFKSNTDKPKELLDPKALLEKKIGHLETFLSVYKIIIIISLIVFILFLGSDDSRSIGVRDGEDALILLAFIVPPTLLHIWLLNRFMNVIAYILKKY